jgi:TonB family protein
MNIKKNIILSITIHVLFIVCAFGLSAKGAAIFNKGTNYLVVSLYADAENKTSAHGKNFSSIKEINDPVGTTIAFNEKAREMVNMIDPSSQKESQDFHGSSEQINNMSRGYHGQINGISAETNSAAYNSNLNTVYGFIRNAIEKAKKYPLIAKKKMIHGTVVAEFSINPSGFPENMVVKKSSGSEILDAAAMKTIIKAAPFPYAEKRIEIPIKFEFN